MSRHLQNLKPWPKGVSGNPGGRPRKKLIDSALEELLLGNDSEIAIAIAQKLLTRARRGEVRAIQLVAERVEGKPRRQIEFSGLDGEPMAIENMTDEQLEKRMNELMEKLNMVRE